MKLRTAKIATPAALLLPLVAHAQLCQWERTPGEPVGAIRDQLFATGGTSGRDVWAVGQAISSGAFHVLIEHFDGSEWRDADAPNPGGATHYHDLRGVVAMAPDEAYAVGGYVPATLGTNVQPLFLAWDGTSWQQEPAPMISPGGGAFYTAAEIDGTIWAGGFRARPGSIPPPAANQYPLIAMWDGSGWQEQDVPLLALTGQDAENDIFGIDGVSNSDIWAVGSADQPPRFTGDPEAFGPDRYIVHFDGSRWELVDAPQPNPFSTGLRDVVAIASDDVWAVGDFQPPGTDATQPYIIHWDGATWTMTELPPFAGRGATLSGVAALGPSEVYAAGATLDSSGMPRPLILRFDGSTWSEMPADSASGTFRGMQELPTGDVWAVGQPLLIERLVCDSGCYADCDGSGSLDFFDFLCFQNQFGSGDPVADCDGSGALDFFDFLCFQNEFGRGCP